MIERLQELEDRVDQLERTIQRFLKPIRNDHEATILMAPVTIVDSGGRTLLEVRRQQHDVSVCIFNTQGRAVASLGVDGTDCGYLAIRDADGGLVGYLDIESAGARLTLEDHAQKGGITLFGGDNDENEGGGINISNADGKVSVSFWAGKERPELTFYDGQENVIDVLP